MHPLAAVLGQLHLADGRLASLSVTDPLHHHPQQGPGRLGVIGACPATPSGLA